MSEESTPESADSPAAGNLGRSLGKLARSARSAARAAQPEAERLARQALEAGEAAVPHVKRASRAAAERAGQFVRDNNDGIQRAAATGAGLVAGRSAPLLRPVIFSVADQLTRKVAGLAEPSATGDEVTPSADPPASPTDDEPPRPNLF